MNEVIEGTVEEVGMEVVPVAQPPSTLFRTDDPVEVVEKASRVADALKSVIDRQGLTSNIRGRTHVRVEGWTTLGSMVGVFPVCTWTRKLENGWEARVEARTLDGHVVGAAEAECLTTESTWKSRDDYALRSMAQTRATSKALRQPLGFIVTLAGYDATPAEEMPTGATAATQTAVKDVEHTGKSDLTPTTTGGISDAEFEDLKRLFNQAGRPTERVTELLDSLGAPPRAQFGVRIKHVSPDVARELRGFLVDAVEQKEAAA